ncbi:class I SAM-dependent methyltransferase [Nitrospira sp. M1]
MKVNTQLNAVQTEIEAVRAYFDSVAPTYEDNPWYLAQGNDLRQFVSEGTTGSVLDIGCGTGWLLRQILKDRPGWTGTGFDLSPLMVETARNKAVADRILDLEFIEGNWETSPFTKTGFSTALCVSAFHYFADPQTSARKVHEALAPGGQFLLMDRELEGAFLNQIWDTMHTWFIKDHCRFYRSSFLIQLLTEAGFSNVKIAARIKKYLWKGKLQTNLVLLSGTAS